MWEAYSSYYLSHSGFNSFCVFWTPVLLNQQCSDLGCCQIHERIWWVWDILQPRIDRSKVLGESMLLWSTSQILGFATKPHHCSHIILTRILWDPFSVAVTLSKSEFMQRKKWSEGFLFLGHGKPASEKNWNSNKELRFDTKMWTKLFRITWLSRWFRIISETSRPKESQVMQKFHIKPWKMEVKFQCYYLHIPQRPSLLLQNRQFHHQTASKDHQREQRLRYSVDELMRSRSFHRKQYFSESGPQRKLKHCPDRSWVHQGRANEGGWGFRAQCWVSSSLHHLFLSNASCQSLYLHNLGDPFPWLFLQQ